MTIRSVTRLSACISTASAQIAAASSLSGSMDFGDAVATRLIMPGFWTAASVSFSVSHDGTTFGPLYDADGTEITYTGSPSRQYVLSPTEWVGVRYVKVRSGVFGSVVDQGSARTVIFQIVG